MKFIQDQLISVLRDTPLETDCSVSITALEMAGVKGGANQRQWLLSQRPTSAGKTWHLVGEHWHFRESFDEDDEPRAASGAPPPLAQPTSRLPSITVKPVRELPRRRPISG